MEGEGEGRVEKTEEEGGRRAKWRKWRGRRERG